MRLEPITTVAQPRYTVSPTIMTQQRPEGLVVLDRANSGYQFGCLVGFTILWNLVTWPVAIGMWFFGPPVARLGFSLLRLIPIVFVIVGLVLIGVLVRKLIDRAMFTKAELQVSAWPIRLGQSVDVTLRRRARGGVQVEQAEARLVCREIVTYTRGTNRHTVTETVFEEALPTVQTLPGMSGIEARWRVTIPQNGAPSFETTNNVLMWSVETKLQVRNFIDSPSSFPLYVLPEVQA